MKKGQQQLALLFLDGRLPDSPDVKTRTMPDGQVRERDVVTVLGTVNAVTRSACVRRVPFPRIDRCSHPPARSLRLK